MIPAQRPLIAHIQRFSLHDGPGLRTTVFLKGCPLRCPWCSNPECIPHGADLMHIKPLCLGVQVCGRCLDACPRQCFQSAVPPQGPPALHRQRCDLCLACARVCPSAALTPVGDALSPAEIVRFCLQDAEAYALSGGGVTVSGGEPLARPAFTAQLLREARAGGLHCAVETCGWFDMDDPQTREALACLDLVIFDLKHTDGDMHARHTGVDTTRIVHNLRRLASQYPQTPVIVRIPVIPGFNADEAALTALAHLASGIPTVTDIELMPYHTFGVSKYAHLGRPYTWSQASPCPPQRMAAWQRMARRCLRERSHGGENALSD